MTRRPLPSANLYNNYITTACLPTTCPMWHSTAPNTLRREDINTTFQTETHQCEHRCAAADLGTVAVLPRIKLYNKEFD